MYRKYVIACDVDDEYDDSVSHVALPLIPSLILRLTWYSLLARLFGRLVGRMNFHRFNVSFRDSLVWLNLNRIDADFPEEWEDGAVVDEIAPAMIAVERVEGDAANLSWLAVWFGAWHHYSGVEYISREIPLRDLQRAVRWSDIRAELSDRFVRWINKERR